MNINTLVSVGDYIWLVDNDYKIVKNKVIAIEIETKSKNPNDARIRYFVDNCSRSYSSTMWVDGNFWLSEDEAIKESEETIKNEKKRIEEIKKDKYLYFKKLVEEYEKENKII